VGSIQLPLAVASASCSSLKALSSDINGKISSKTEIQFVCDGSCCFHSKEMVLHGVGNFRGDLPEICRPTPTSLAEVSLAVCIGRIEIE
jgi:hypothetical protein